MIDCKITFLCCSNFVPSFVEFVLNNTLEERVALLEIQVEELDEDLTVTRIDLTELEGYVDFLFDEQENDVIDDELESEISL